MDILESDDRQMIYLIVRILIEKPFYLLRRQSFSFQIMSETLYKYICEIFLLYVPGVGSLTPRFVPGEGFVHSDCPGRGRVFAPFESCPGGMVLDEIDNCISFP